MLGDDNMKYGKLTIISIEMRIVGSHHRKYAHVKCDCGKEFDTRYDSLLSGNTTSCGCMVKEKHFKTHGESKTKLYHVWATMKNRCYNVNDRNYHLYGGRGIKVHDDWKNPDSYLNFKEWSINHGYKEGLTLDRINVNGDYEPNNCRWITQQEQMNNTRRNINISYHGETLNINQWAKRLGINKNTLWHYIRVKNYTIEDVIEIRDKKCND